MSMMKNITLRTDGLSNSQNNCDVWRDVVKELLGKAEDIVINSPFYCDYGKHIEVGKNFIDNYNCTSLDVGKIKIGDNVVIGA